MSALRRGFGPPFAALGLLWPWTVPWEIAAARGRREAVDAAAPTFTLVATNALGPNRRADEFAAAVAALDVDVVVVVEASAAILAALDDAEVEAHHGPGLVEPRERWGGCGIWSRHRLELLESGDAGYAYIAARVHLPTGPVTAVAVHTIAPAKPTSGPAWEASFVTLGDVLGRLDGPVVAAGDYNATLGHQPLRALLTRTGMRDAHTAAGRGLARSWPASPGLPPLGLIDRMLLTDDLGVVSITEIRLPGTDHLAVRATLAISPPGGGAPAGG